MTDFYQRFQNLNLDLANFEEYIEKTEKAMKKMNLEKIRNEFLSEKYQYQKYYPIIYKEKYLRDLTQSDDQKQNKIINNNIGDKSDDCVFDLLLNGYEKLYGKKIYSEKDIKKRNNFTYLLFVVLSLFTMILAYFIFKKLN